jgi:hypothetical protein
MYAKSLKKGIAGTRLLKKQKRDGKSLFTSLWLSLNKNRVLELMPDQKELSSWASSHGSA